MEHSFNLENNLVILSKQTIDEILKNDTPGDLISLYVFYYYTAKWQKTNSIFCTTKFSRTALGWGFDRLHKADKALQELGLIEKINRRGADGKISGWYIKLKYLWGADTVNNLIYKHEEFPSYDREIFLWREFENLKRYDSLSEDIFRKYNGKCNYCGTDLRLIREMYAGGIQVEEIWDFIKKNPGKTASIDHIIPLSKGGTNNIENLCLSCLTCNSKKKNQIQQFPNLVSAKSGFRETNALSADIKNAFNANNKTQHKFSKPNLEDVVFYMSELNIDKPNVEANKFIDYYESVGWKIGGKSPMKDWKAAIRNWKRNLEERKNNVGYKNTNSRLTQSRPSDFSHLTESTIS